MTNSPGKLHSPRCYQVAAPGPDRTDLASVNGRVSLKSLLQLLQNDDLLDFVDLFHIYNTEKCCDVPPSHIGTKNNEWQHFSNPIL